MTNFYSKHLALFIVLKNKKDSADLYCITLTELQAHRDAIIQKNKYIQFKDVDSSQLRLKGFYRKNKLPNNKHIKFWTSVLYCGLLDYTTVQPSRQAQKLRSKILPSSSGLKCNIPDSISP